MGEDDHTMYELGQGVKDWIELQDKLVVIAEMDEEGEGLNTVQIITPYEATMLLVNLHRLHQQVDLLVRRLATT